MTETVSAQEEAADKFAEERVLEHLTQKGSVQYLNFGPQTKTARRLAFAGKILILEDNPYQSRMSVIRCEDVAALWKEVKELRKKHARAKELVAAFLESEEAENE